MKRAETRATPRSPRLDDVVQSRAAAAGMSVCLQALVPGPDREACIRFLAIDQYALQVNPVVVYCPGIIRVSSSASARS